MKKAVNIMLALCVMLAAVSFNVSADGRVDGAPNPISAGFASSFAIDADGNLWGWGDLVVQGRTGVWTVLEQRVPTIIMDNVVSVSSSGGTWTYHHLPRDS